MKLKTVNSKLKINSPGFTLIELLIVIAIIGILTSMGLYSWGSAQQKARDNRRKNDLKSIQQALENYYQNYGNYPGTATWNGQLSGSDATVLNLLQGPYVSKIPQDPVYPNTNQDYFYCVVSDSAQKKYNLYSILENTKDSEYGTYNVSDAGVCSNITSVYHFKVTNY